MPNYIVGNRETGPTLADFLRGVNDSIGTYADIRYKQIGLDREAAAAQAAAQQAERQYMLDRDKLRETRRGRHDDMEQHDQRLGYDLMELNRVKVPQVGINQQNADTNRMGENRQGALQDRRFGMADQFGGMQPSGGMTLGDVLAAQSAALNGQAITPPSSSAASRADTVSQTDMRDFQRGARQSGYDHFRNAGTDEGMLAAVRAAEGADFDVPATVVSNRDKVREEARELRLGNDYDAYLNRITGVGGEREAFTFGDEASEPVGAIRTQGEALRYILNRDGIPPRQVLKDHPDYLSRVMNVEDPGTLDQYENQRAKALGGIQDRFGSNPDFTPSELPPSKSQTLYEAAGEAHGVYPTLLAGLSRVFGQFGVPIAEETLEARQVLRTAAGELRRTMSINPRFPEGEMNRLMEEFNSILPSMWNSGPAAQKDLETVVLSVADRIAQFEADARNEYLDEETREMQFRNANALRSFVRQVGVPPEGTAQGNSSAGAQSSPAPPDVPQDVWDEMTPEERALWP